MGGRKPGPQMPADLAYSHPELDVYVPPGDSGQEIAVLLTGTAEEFGIPQSHIRSDGRGGFWISDDLADIVYADVEDAAIKDADEGDDPTQTPDSPETGSTTTKTVTQKGKTK